VSVESTDGCLVVVEDRMLGCHLGCLDGTEQPEATLRNESSVGVLRSRRRRTGSVGCSDGRAVRCDAMRGWRRANGIHLSELLIDASLPFHPVQLSPCLGMAFQRAPISLRSSAMDKGPEPLMRRRHRTHTG
jgi:hypothetical protein